MLTGASFTPATETVLVRVGELASPSDATTLTVRGAVWGICDVLLYVNERKHA